MDNAVEIVARVTQRNGMSRPLLGVSGDTAGFGESVLGKLGRRYFQPILAEPSHIRGPMPMTWIRWMKDNSSPIDRTALPAHATVLNDAPLSVEKVTVQRCFEQVFGYALAVDPRIFAGPIVIKSNRNATHDGRVVAGPLKNLPEGDIVFQRLVDNGAGDLQGLPVVCDIRLPVIRGRVPFAYLKIRPVGTRFSNTNAFAKLAAVSDVLVPTEVESCLAFAAQLGLDYGEIDVLRDRDDGRIYIVDANNRPHGPPNGLHPLEQDVALRLLGDAVLGCFFR